MPAAIEETPKTNRVYQYYGSVDKDGEIAIEHPKNLNGQKLEAQHYPPTGRELREWAEKESRQHGKQ